MLRHVRESSSDSRRRSLSSQTIGDVSDTPERCDAERNPPTPYLSRIDSGSMVSGLHATRVLTEEKIEEARVSASGS